MALSRSAAVALGKHCILMINRSQRLGSLVYDYSLSALLFEVVPTRVQQSCMLNSNLQVLI